MHCSVIAKKLLSFSVKYMLYISLPVTFWTTWHRLLYQRDMSRCKGKGGQQAKKRDKDHADTVAWGGPTNIRDLQRSLVVLIWPWFFTFHSEARLFFPSSFLSFYLSLSLSLSLSHTHSRTPALSLPILLTIR